MSTDTQRRVHKLRRLVLVGSLMAQRLHDYADELDRSSSTNPQRPERHLEAVRNDMQ